MTTKNPIVSINIESGNGGKSTNFLNGYNNLFFKQTRKGWLQNCCGCENKVGYSNHIQLLTNNNTQQ